jgi:hypothetical protein
MALLPKRFAPYLAYSDDAAPPTGLLIAQLIAFIKAWTEGEGKNDQEILAAAVNPQPRWPWPTAGEFDDRLAEVTARAQPEGMKGARERRLG